MSRTERINSLLEQEIADFINKEVEVKDCLITVTYVQISPDLKHARVGVSVIPSNVTGTSLRQLRKKTHLLTQTLRKKFNWRQIPAFKWEVDRSSKKAQEISDTIDQARQEDADNS